MEEKFLKESDWNKLREDGQNEEELLDSMIKYFYEQKTIHDHYKKEVDDTNKDIKTQMEKLNKTEFETDNGLKAKITVQNRESFIEENLIAKIKELGLQNLIQTKEYVDMDALEDAIYNGKLNASELSNCRQIKQIITLKVSKRKEK